AFLPQNSPIHDRPYCPTRRSSDLSPSPQSYTLCKLDPIPRQLLSKPRVPSLYPVRRSPAVVLVAPPFTRRILPARKRWRHQNHRSEEHTSELQSLKQLLCRLPPAT